MTTLRGLQLSRVPLLLFASKVCTRSEKIHQIHQKEKHYLYESRESSYIKSFWISVLFLLFPVFLNSQVKLPLRPLLSDDCYFLMFVTLRVSLLLGFAKFYCQGHYFWGLFHLKGLIPFSSITVQTKKITPFQKV